jgi:DNA-directed RNA polymerase
MSDITNNEAPLLSLPPGVSILSPSKPRIEMTDAELQAWHTRLRDHANHQTMMAHQNALTVKTKPAGGRGPEVTMEDF